MINIYLIGNPQSTNHLYKYGRSGVYMKEAGVILKRDYYYQVKQQWKDKPLQGDLTVHIKLFFGDKRKRDVDNHMKIILDSLSTIVWEDDSQIKTLQIRKLYDKINPRAEVTIK